MNRRVLFSGLILVLLLVGLGAGLFLVRNQQDIRQKAVPASTLSILPPTKTVKQGDSFALSVGINTAENVATAAELYITYDKDKLSLISVTPGTFLPVVLVQPSVNNATGLATMTFGAQPANPPQGSGLLATLNFKAVAAGSARVGFGPQSQATGIDETTNVIVGMNPSTVTIAAVEAGKSSGGQVCAQVITPAKNNTTGECKEFPNSCIPEGWTKVSSCPTAEKPATGKPTVTLPAGKTFKAGDKITGTAKPGDTVNITIESHTITATATADSQGNWSYTLPQDLEQGTHTITITDSTGSTSDTFTLASADTTSATTGTGGAGTTTTTSPSPSPSSSLEEVTAEDLPVTATSWPTVVGFVGGILMVLLGLALAF